MQEFTVFCDAGSVRLGLGDNYYYIPNGYGDGRCTVELYDVAADFDGCGSYNGIVEGNDIRLYDYDCSNADVVAVLSGRYHIYTIGDTARHFNHGAVAFVRFADYEVADE